MAVAYQVKFQHFCLWRWLYGFSQFCFSFSQHSVQFSSPSSVSLQLRYTTKAVPLLTNDIHSIQRKIPHQQVNIHTLQCDLRGAQFLRNTLPAPPSQDTVSMMPFQQLTVLHEALHQSNSLYASVTMSVVSFCREFSFICLSHSTSCIETYGTVCFSKYPWMHKNKTHRFIHAICNFAILKLKPSLLFKQKRGGDVKDVM